MKRLIVLMLILFTLNSCEKDPKEHLANLNGYWEIEKVEFSKDSIRDFKINEIVEYIEITDSTGFRRKVKPQFNGSYIPAGEPERIAVAIEDNELVLNYSTGFNNWKEVVVDSKEDAISLKNERGITYHYKRYKPLKLDLDEEEK